MSIITPRPVSTLMQYGVTQDFAQRVHGLGLTVTTIRGTSIKNLVSKYGLSTGEAQELKRCVEREPIEPSVMNRLLSRSNFVCSVCKGAKGLSFVIHHIAAYEQTQDNTEDNLIVVCPADHDLAHQAGLSMRIAPEQLRVAKAEWEKTVEAINAGRAVQCDFIRMGDDGPSPSLGALGPGGSEPRQASEMVLLLRAKFPGCLRPEIRSVQLVQTPLRCSLEITTVTQIGAGLEDEHRTRTDLAFITHGSGLLFPPGLPMDQHVSRFMSDMDELSIVHCTDLFTDEAATEIARSGCGGWSSLWRGPLDRGSRPEIP